MKQVLLASTLTLLFFSFSFAQINILWESRFDSNPYDDYAKDIGIDLLGNSYVVGSSYNGAQFNIITIKYAPDGTELWNAAHDGPASGLDNAVGLVIDSNGDVIIGGYHQVSGTDFDIFAKKLDGTSGATVWTYTYTGTANFDQLRSIAIDDNNNVILAGGLELGGGNTNFITLSVSPSGTLNWDQTYSNSTNRDFASAVTVDAMNSVYVTGESDNGGDGLDYYTIKYNAAGAEQWAVRTDGSGQEDRPYDITVSDDGSTYVVGTSYRGLSDDDDIMLVKIDNAGGFVWDRVIGGTEGGDDKARSVNTDPLNNVYITGNVKNIGNGEDYYVARYRPNGDFHWDFIYQSPTNGFDEARGLKVNSNYELYVSGYSNITESSDDYLTIRLDTLGNNIWTKRFDGPASSSDQMSAFIIDDFGNIFVTGSSVGSGSLRDYSTIRYCQLETIAPEDDTICAGEPTQLVASGGINFQWSVFEGEPITGDNFSCTSCNNPTASPSETTTYLVSSESNTGCVDFDTVVVVVNPLPAINIIARGPTSFCEGRSLQLVSDIAEEYSWSTGEDTESILVTTAGIYTLTITDAIGCQNSEDIEIVVFNKPVVNGGNDIFRCPGSEVTLTATGADSLAWFTLPDHNDTLTNGETFIPISNGTYKVVGITDEGCKSSDTIDITLFPTPFQIELEQGTNGDLIANTTDENALEWLLDGDSLHHIGTTFTYDEEPYCNGLYSITYTDENGCKSEHELEITDACEDTANVNSYNLETFNLYPNPTTNVSKITFEQNTHRLITVYDPQGKIIIETATDSLSHDIDLSNAVSGTYFIKIVSNEKVGHAKLVKN